MNKLCNTEEKKAFFFDIDGTLHCASVGIPLSAKEGIKKLKEKRTFGIYLHWQNKGYVI